MLSVQNLSCRRGGRMVFRDAGFAVELGGFTLITGMNGSGKSSLLRMLAGLIEPASGRIEWQGADVGQDPAAHRGRLHYIGHSDAVKPGLTVREMLEYWGALRGAVVGIETCLKAFTLTKLADSPVRYLSAGQKRRLSLTRLELTPAPLWLLDEPTTALDVHGQALLRGAIERHRAKGGMVIAASHDDPKMSEMRVFEVDGVK